MKRKRRSLSLQTSNNSLLTYPLGVWYTLQYETGKGVMTMEKKITIYTTPSCPYCTTAKQYFRQMGLSFQEKDVSKDQRAAQMMVQKTGQMGVPVIEIGSDYVVGFDKAKINRYLGRSV